MATDLFRANDTSRTSPHSSTLSPTREPSSLRARRTVTAVKDYKVAPARRFYSPSDRLTAKPKP